MKIQTTCVPTADAALIAFQTVAYFQYYVRGYRPLHVPLHVIMVVVRPFLHYTATVMANGAIPAHVPVQTLTIQNHLVMLSLLLALQLLFSFSSFLVGSACSAIGYGCIGVSYRLVEMRYL